MFRGNEIAPSFLLRCTVGVEFDDLALHRVRNSRQMAKDLWGTFT